MRRREISKLKSVLKSLTKVWGKTIIQYTAVEEFSLHRDDLFASPYQEKRSEPARACTGFRRGFEVWEAIRGLRDRVINLNLNLNADDNYVAYAA